MSTLQQPVSSSRPVPSVLSSGANKGRKSRSHMAATGANETVAANNHKRLRVHESVPEEDCETYEPPIAKPCAAPPGSEEKLLILKQRAEAREDMFNSNDASMDAYGVPGNTWTKLPGHTKQTLANNTGTTLCNYPAEVR